MSQQSQPVVLPDLPPMPVLQKMLEMEEAGHGVTRYKDRTGTLLSGYYAIWLQRSVRSFDVTHEVTYAIETGHLANGLKHGQWQVRYCEQEEALNYDVSYQEGHLHGPFTVYDLDQRVQYKTSFVHGNGRWKFFFGNAKLKVEGMLQDGQPDGLWQYRTANGRPEKQLLYQQGTLLNTTPAPN